MCFTLTAAERDKTLALSNYQRYQYFIDMVSEQGEIWSLANDEGWVTLSAEGDNCLPIWPHADYAARSEEHTSELQSRPHLVCRLLLEKKKDNNIRSTR